MPIYEYECNECGHRFEVVQKMSDRPKRKCESCGRLRARRLVSQTNFVLKGTGWYTTDYAGKKAHGKDEPAPSAEDSSSGSSSKTSTGSDTTKKPSDSSSKEAAKKAS